jgi:hypothetical protein
MTSTPMPWREKRAVWFAATAWVTTRPAAQDQEIGDRLAEIGPLGDGQHVVAALGGRDGDEILIGQALGPDQDRARDGDLVEGELAHDAARRIRDGREPDRQFDARPQFDRTREPADHDIEDADLVLVHAGSRAEEKIGQPGQNLGAVDGRAAQHRRLKIPQKGTDRTHSATSRNTCDS